MQGWGINHAAVIRVTLFQQNFILRIAKKDQNRERKSSRYCEETWEGGGGGDYKGKIDFINIAF